MFTTSAATPPPTRTDYPTRGTVPAEIEQASGIVEVSGWCLRNTTWRPNSRGTGIVAAAGVVLAPAHLMPSASPAVPSSATGLIVSFAGQHYPATINHVDRSADVVVLWVRRLPASPARLVRAATSPDTQVTVVSHPIHGSEPVQQPAVVTRYRRVSARPSGTGFALARLALELIHPGIRPNLDGAAVLDESGRVVAMVYTSNAGVAYAIPARELLIHLSAGDVDVSP